MGIGNTAVAATLIGLLTDHAAEEVTGRKVPVRYGPRRAGDPDSLVADPSLARELLGWEASRKDVREMLRPAWLWMNGPGGGRFPANG